MVKLDFKAVSVRIHACHGRKRGVPLRTNSDIFICFSVDDDAAGNILLIRCVFKQAAPVVLINNYINGMNLCIVENFGFIRHRSACRLDSKCCAVHEKSGYNHGKHDYSDTNSVNIFMPNQNGTPLSRIVAVIAYKHCICDTAKLGDSVDKACVAAFVEADFHSKLDPAF